MSGHSKWSTIKRKKAATDSKRGKIFTKALREVQVAARLGGSSLDSNFRLKTAVLAAKAVSVPNDSIDRAIKRGAGESDGEQLEEITYEGYGPNGIAVLVKAMTDNRNRTASEVRHTFTRYGGSLGSANSVAYLFSEKGVVVIPKALTSEDKLFDTALGAGADDVVDEGDSWEVLSAIPSFEAVRNALIALGEGVEAEIRLIPATSVLLAGEAAESALKLMEMLDDLDDVQSVVSNFEVEDSEER